MRSAYKQALKQYALKKCAQNNSINNISNKKKGEKKRVNYFLTSVTTTVKIVVMI